MGLGWVSFVRRMGFLVGVPRFEVCRFVLVGCGLRFVVS